MTWKLSFAMAVATRTLPPSPAPHGVYYPRGQILVPTPDRMRDMLREWKRDGKI